VRGDSPPESTSTQVLNTGAFLLVSMRDKSAGVGTAEDTYTKRVTSCMYYLSHAQRENPRGWYTHPEMQSTLKDLDDTGPSKIKKRRSPESSVRKEEVPIAEWYLGSIMRLFPKPILVNTKWSVVTDTMILISPGIVHCQLMVKQPLVFFITWSWIVSTYIYKYL